MTLPQGSKIDIPVWHGPILFPQATLLQITSLVELTPTFGHTDRGTRLQLIQQFGCSYEMVGLV